MTTTPPDQPDEKTVGDFMAELHAAGGSMTFTDADGVRWHAEKVWVPGSDVAAFERTMLDES